MLVFLLWVKLVHTATKERYGGHLTYVLLSKVEKQGQSSTPADILVDNMYRLKHCRKCYT